MAQNTKALSDAEILTKVSEKALKSVGWYDSRLSKERERVMRYYNGLLPARQHPGSSSYVSTDVYDAVEMCKAQLAEVFSGSDEIAQFDPDQDMGAEDCRVATQYARYVIFRENGGTSLFEQVIHDGLTARAGIVKVYWEDNYTYAEEEFSGIDHASAMGVAAQDDVDEFDATLQPDGTYSGGLTRKTDCCKVCIDPLAPEEFLIERAAVSLKDAKYSGHRTKKTKAQLVDMGYKKSQVDKISTDENKSMDLSAETLARQEPTDNGALQNDDGVQPELDEVTYYESYMKLKIDPAKGVRLYKICHAGGQLLDYEEVDKAPFIVYVPLPVPHTFYGNNFAARVIPVQNARTVLTRGVLDHTSITTNPRWLVVNGGLLQPREMLENRLGGLVNVRRPDSIAPLQYPNLNPFIFEVLGMLKDDKEQSTGISALAQGLNKDAISKQNSQGLIDNLVSLSGQRSKIAARNFANFLVELMLEVVRLGILNQKKAKIIEVAGKPLSVTPAQWTARTTCTVSMHLGYGEADQAAGKIMAAYERLGQDPAIAPMFTALNRYNMIIDAFKLAKLNGARYITNPAQVQPPQPDPQKTAETQAKVTTANAAMLTAQTAAKKEADKTQLETAKIMQKGQDATAKAVDQTRKNDRQDLDTASRVNVNQREMTLAENTAHREAFITPGH